MISFRYHVVSIAAVFLALVVGIVAGSNVIRGPLVDSLRANVKSAERNLQAVSDENKRLSGDVSRYQEVDRALAKAGLPQIDSEMLEATDVLLVWAGGVDGDDMRTVRDSLRNAGARIVDDVRLQESLALANEDAVTTMARALGVTSTDATALRSIVVEKLATALTAVAVADEAEMVHAPAPDGSTTTRPTNPQNTTTTIPVATALLDLRAALDGLADAGFVKIENRVAATPRPYVRLVLVGASGAAPAGDALVYPLLDRMARLSPFTVAVETRPVRNDVGRGEFMRGLRSDAQLRGSLSTVDDGDLWTGQVAMILALHALDDGKVGQYGVGDGADAVLPPFES